MKNLVTNKKIRHNTCKYRIKSLFLQTEIIRSASMCRYNLSFNDAVVDEVRPHFADEESLRLWMQVQMEHLMKEYAAQFKKPSLDGEQLLSRLKSLGDTPDGFLRLDTVLPPSQSSIEELREEAYFEKYGI